MIEKLKTAWNWIKDHERVQGIIIVLFVEGIGLVVIWSIKCGL